MSILARHVAEARELSGDHIDLHTELPRAHEAAIGPIGDKRIDHGAIQIVLRNALPSPSKDVAYGDILDFRERHRGHLLAFRTAVRHLTDVTYDSGGTASDVVDEIEGNLLAVTSAARRRGWAVTLTTVTISAATTLAALEPASREPLKWALGGVGGAAALSIIPRLVRGGEKPPFAYLHFAQRELVRSTD